jgi:DNA-binding CsgD family transcriptional regulator
MLLARDERPDLGEVLVAEAASLDRLVPSNMLAWMDIDLRATRAEVRGFPRQGLQDERLAKTLVATAGDHPVVQSYLASARRNDLSPRRMSDVATRAELRRTRAWAELLRPLRAEYHASLLVVRTGTMSARSWGFNRDAHDFTDEEVSRLSAVQPLLALVEHVVAAPRREAGAAAERWGLTAREAEMLGHLADGLTADAIGSLCGISGRTVRKHLEHAYEKLGAHDKVTAILRFRGESADR